ncbi:hypothetical protein J6590_009991 [Homalodisca vitripennis]|nr:hypothetical protein J6590_009991 [Homalodisca vitripennis]
MANVAENNPLVTTSRLSVHPLHNLVTQLGSAEAIVTQNNQGSIGSIFTQTVRESVTTPQNWVVVMVEETATLERITAAPLYAALPHSGEG